MAIAFLSIEDSYGRARFPGALMKTYKQSGRRAGRHSAPTTAVGRLAALLGRVAANDFCHVHGTSPDADGSTSALTLQTEHSGRLPQPANDVTKQPHLDGNADVT
jgi:hypothetical protein